MHPSASTLDRLALAELPAAAEERLRIHLRRCAACRATYDERVLLHRALAGDPARPTRTEDERLIRRALAGAGLRLPAPAPFAGNLVLWHPWRVAAAVALTLGLAVAGLRSIGGGTSGSLVAPASAGRGPSPTGLVAGRLLRSRGTLLGGLPAQKGASIRTGDTLAVETASGEHAGAAEIALARGGTLRVFPGATLSLGPDGELVQLATGKVWCLPEHNGRPFAVATHEGEVRALGTSFVVERRGDETEVRVVQGTVEVEDAEHRGALRLRGEEQTDLRTGRPPAPARRYGPARDEGDWDRAFSDLWRALRRLFEGR